MSSCKLHMIYPPLTHTQLATQYIPKHITNTTCYTVHTKHITNTTCYTVHTKTHHKHNLLHSTHQNTSQTQLTTQYTPKHITNTTYYTVHTKTHHKHNLLHSTHQNTSQTQLTTQYTLKHITNTTYYTVHTKTHHKHNLLHSTHQNTSQTLDPFTRIDIHMHVATCTVTIFIRRMCLFLNTVLQPNVSLQFLNHFAMCILIMKFQIRQQYLD